MYRVCALLHPYATLTQINAAGALMPCPEVSGGRSTCCDCHSEQTLRGGWTAAEAI